MQHKITKDCRESHGYSTGRLPRSRGDDDRAGVRRRGRRRRDPPGVRVGANADDEPLAGLAVPGLTADEEEEAAAVECHGGDAAGELAQRVRRVAPLVVLLRHLQQRVVLVLEIYLQLIII